MPPSFLLARFSKPPDHPEGYVLEGEALWWKRYCAACEIKYGMFEAWKHEKRPEDDAYLELADRNRGTRGSATRQVGNRRNARLRGNGLCAEGARLWAAQRESQCGASGRERALRDAARARDRSADGRRNRRAGSLQLLRRHPFAHREIPSLLYGHSGRKQGTRGEADGSRNESGRSRGARPLHSCQGFAAVRSEIRRGPRHRRAPGGALSAQSAFLAARWEI